MDKKSFFERLNKVLPSYTKVLEIGSAEKNHNNEIIHAIEPDIYNIYHPEEEIQPEVKYDFIFANTLDIKDHDKILENVKDKLHPQGYIAGDGFIKYMYNYSKIKNFVEENKLKMVFATELGLWAATKIN